MDCLKTFTVNQKDWAVEHLLDCEGRASQALINTKQLVVLGLKRDEPLTGNADLLTTKINTTLPMCFTMPVKPIRDLNGYYYLVETSQIKDQVHSALVA